MRLPRRRSAIGATTLVLVSLSLILALGYAIIRVTAAVRGALAYCEFESSLATSDQNRSRAFLKKLFHPPLLLSFYELNGGDDYIAGIDSSKKYEILKDMHAVLGLLADNRSEKAILRFNSLRNEQLPQLLYSLSPERESIALLRDLEKQFADYKMLQRELAEAASATPETIAVNEQRLAQTREWLKDLADEFATLLSLPTSMERKEVELYQNGVLEGLPKLPQLPDGIPDLIALKSELGSAGGEVKIAGSRAPELFKEKLDSFRSSSSLYISEISKLTESNKQLQEGHKALKVRNLDQSLKLQAKIEEFLRRAAKPQPDRAAELFLRLWSGYAACAKQR